MKKKISRKAVLFWANWDLDFYKKITNFETEAKKLKIDFDTVDVETRSGVKSSIAYGIRNVPAIAILNGDKLVAVEKGNSAYTRMKRYFR